MHNLALAVSNNVTPRDQFMSPQVTDNRDHYSHRFSLRHRRLKIEHTSDTYGRNRRNRGAVVTSCLATDRSTKAHCQTWRSSIHTTSGRPM